MGVRLKLKRLVIESQKFIENIEIDSVNKE
jgi:hypothetical protein